MPAYGSIPKISPEDNGDGIHEDHHNNDESSPLMNSNTESNSTKSTKTKTNISTTAINIDIATATATATFQRQWENLVFNWFTPVLDIGNHKKRLDQEDMDLVPLPQDCQTVQIAETFYRHWQAELNHNSSSSDGDDGDDGDDDNGTTTKPTTNKKHSKKQHQPSMVRALWNSFGREFMQAGALKLVHDSCIFVGPQVLNAMIYYLRDANASIWQGLGLTTLVTVSQLTMSFCLRHYFFTCYAVGLKIRSAIVVAVYHKALVLDAGERQTRTVGEITNLMSIDAKRLQDLTTYLHAIWYTTFQIALALYFLWKELGASSLGGVLVMIIMMPVTKSVSQWMGRRQKKVMKAKDERVEVNSEVMSNIKVIKLQAWEESFQDKIMKYRDQELSQLLTYFIGSAASTMLWNGTPVAVAVATFAAYVWSGNTLEVASALTSLALFDILRFPLFMLPQIVNRIVEAGVSLQRVQSFLLCKEHASIQATDTARSGVELANLSAAYESQKPRLDDDMDLYQKEWLKTQWEASLLQSQLAEAERKIHALLQQGEGTSKSETKPLTVEEAHSSATHGLPEADSRLLSLKRVDFHCGAGELVAVVGMVGCGKSTLINTILGEVRTLSGTSSVKGSLSYFSQSPFIMNATIRDNILFSHINDAEIDEERYQRALKCCALLPDMETFAKGDLTEVGERGVTLSGGQKARVALARAVYHLADISLIDDALSAVDAHVAKHLFQECIIGELLTASRSKQKRSVVLVTNALQFLSHPRVDRIVVINEGRIAEQGTYKELASIDNSLFARFLAAMEESAEHSATDDDLSDATPDAASPKEDTAAKTKPESPVKPQSSDKTTQKTHLMTEEARSTGHVAKDVYLAWAKAAGGYWIPIAIVLMFGSVEGMNVLAKWWLTYWSSHSTSTNQGTFLGIYAGINLGFIILSFIAMIFLIFIGMRASRNLFHDMLSGMMEAPMSFFDTTPIGRIINRFSKDISTIDEDLIMTLRMYIRNLTQILSTILVISGVSPVFTACLIPIIFFYVKEQAFFTITYRELKRLDSINRSPLYALLGETVDGVAVIRAFQAQNVLERRLKKYLDTQQHAYYLTCSAQCWLAVRLELIGTLIITFACLSAVIQHNSLNGDETKAGLFGLAISFSLSITQSLNWSVRMASDFEAQMVAVERVKNYCEIQKEGERRQEIDASLQALTIRDRQWPSGEISFKNSKLRYRPELPLVLKGLDITIPAGSKVGVVGRTGAGKSTLMIALLRLVELDSGYIFFDDVDAKKVGLALLRSKIAVIPQDPVLFAGDIRANLDPFNQYPDSVLYEVLDRVGLCNLRTVGGRTASSSSLSSLVSQYPVHSLGDSVSEGGTNFSLGQRQLVVIARALLCGSSIIIMDEATASVDADTDARIQAVMRSEFKNATCIIIAHRLPTIMDSDFILVMDDGKAVEFENPKTLLRDPTGVFRQLYEASTNI